MKKTEYDRKKAQVLEYFEKAHIALTDEEKENIDFGYLPCLLKRYHIRAGWFYSFFRVKKIPMIAPTRIIGAALTNSHSNE